MPTAIASETRATRAWRARTPSCSLHRRGRRGHERWPACLVGQGFADADGDGEDDRGDRCLDTPSLVAVDDSGCSLAQFCAAQGDSCESADWRNDEPRGKARDCARTGSRAAGFTCQPAAERGRR